MTCQCEDRPCCGCDSEEVVELYWEEPYYDDDDEEEE